jgi:hypothetical protein
MIKLKKTLIGVLVGIFLISGVAYAELPNMPTIKEFAIKLFVNGKQINNDVPPTIINGRTMVPIRTVAESLNADVIWNEENQTVNIFIKSSNEDTNKARALYDARNFTLELEETTQSLLQANTYIEDAIAKDLLDKNPQECETSLIKAEGWIQTAQVQIDFLKSNKEYITNNLDREDISNRFDSIINVLSKALSDHYVLDDMLEGKFQVLQYETLIPISNKRADTWNELYELKTKTLPNLRDSL